MSAVSANINSIKAASIILIATGFCLVGLSYFNVGSVFLAGTGIAAMILGLAGIALVGGTPKTSLEIYRINRVKILFFLTLALVLSVVSGLLIIFNQSNPDIYFVADNIAFLIIVLAYINLDSRSKTALRYISLLLFFAFLVVLVLKVIQML
jgi:hypothetical protein